MLLDDCIGHLEFLVVTFLFNQIDVMVDLTCDCIEILDMVVEDCTVRLNKVIPLHLDEQVGSGHREQSCVQHINQS